MAWSKDPGLADRHRVPAAVAAEPVGAELFLVDLDRGTTYSLNGTGRKMFELASAGLTAEEIGERLHAELGAPRARVVGDAAALIAQLVRDRLLEALPGVDA